MAIDDRLKGKSIIYMDDCTVNLEFWEVMLSKLGADITATTDAKKAMQLVKEK